MAGLALMPSSEGPSASGSETVLFRGGILFDGSGSLPRVEDLRLGNGRILERGRSLAADASTVVDLSGHYVAPGFVDVHSHSDMTVLANPALESKVFQGITTEIVGNCGESLFPLSPDRRKDLAAYVESLYPGLTRRLRWDWTDLPSWTEKVHRARPSINLAPLVGHGTVRVAVSGLEGGPLSAESALDAETWVARSLRDGAFGLSYRLDQAPGSGAATDELEPFVRQVARYGAVYATHLRDEGLRVRESVAEAIALAEHFGARLEISHLKCVGRGRWGLAAELLGTIREARDRGLEVRADFYPYEAVERSLSSLLPRWATDGPWVDIERRLSDPKVRTQIRREVAAGLTGWSLGPQDFLWRDLVVAAVSSPVGRRFAGRSLQEIGDDVRLDPLDVAIDLFLAERGRVTLLVFAMATSDVRAIENDPGTLVGSDGVGVSVANDPLEGPLHARNYGTFPRFLSDLSELGPLALARGVRRVTALPCQHFGIPDRGTVSVGRAADLVVWPSDRRDPGPDLRDRPRYARLFSSVWVAGEPVVYDGRLTGRRPGRVLAHSLREAPAVAS